MDICLDVVDTQPHCSNIKARIQAMSMREQSVEEGMRTGEDASKRKLHKIA
jgi:hypothetical protein